MKRLIFVENLSQLKPALAAAVHDPTAHFMAVNSKLADEIRRRGYICIAFYPEDVFVTKEEVDLFETEVWHIAKHWYQSEVFSETLKYGQFSLGAAVELYMGNALVWTLRNWLWLKRIFQTEDPDEILCFGESKKDADQFFPRAGELFVAKLSRCLGRKVVVRALVSAPAIPNTLSIAKDVARQVMRVCYQSLQRPKPRSSIPRILIASAPQHVRTVIAALKKEADVLYLDESFRVSKLDTFKTNQVSYFSYAQIKGNLSSASRERLSRLRSRLDRSVSDAEDLAKRSNAFYFQGEDISSLIADKIRFFLSDAAHEAATYYEVFQQFISDEGVQAVLVDEDTVTFRKCLVLAARAQKRATFQIPHGVSLSDFHYDLFPVSSDRVLVAAGGIKDFYEQHGVPKEAMDMVGIPRYDELARSFTVESRARVRSQYGWSASDKVVLFAPTVSLDVSIRLRSSEAESALIRFAKAMLEIQAKLVVKFHPLDADFEEKKALFCKIGLAGSVFIKEGDAALLASASDLVVSFASNLAIECLAFEKPVLWLDTFSLSSSHVTYLDSPACDFRVGPKDDLKSLIKLRLSGSRKAQVAQHAAWFRDHWVGLPDGLAGERAAQIILGCVRASELEEMTCKH